MTEDRRPGHGLATWLCTAPREEPWPPGPCNTRNLALQPYCPVCRAPRPKPSMFRTALEQRRQARD